MSAAKGGECLLHSTEVRLRMAAGDGGEAAVYYGDSPLRTAWPAWKAAHRWVALAASLRVKRLPAAEEARDE